MNDIRADELAAILGQAAGSEPACCLPAMEQAGEAGRDAEAGDDSTADPADQLDAAMRDRYSPAAGGVRTATVGRLACPYCRGAMEPAKAAMHPILIVLTWLMALGGLGVALQGAVIWAHGEVLGGAAVAMGGTWAALWIAIRHTGRKSVWRCRACRSVIPRG
jgi:hypothetical protein